MSINEIQDQIIEELTILDDWMDRYALLIEWGDALPLLNDDEKRDEHLIAGCQSRVWIVCSLDADKRMRFKADSDALITKGIASLFVRIFDGQQPCDVAAAELYFIDRVGLTEHLSPTRSNGLVSMLETIKQKAKLLCE